MLLTNEIQLATSVFTRFKVILIPNIWKGFISDSFSNSSSVYLKILVNDLS